MTSKKCLYNPNVECPIYPYHPFQKLDKEYCLRNCLKPYESEIGEDLKSPLDEEPLKENYPDEVITTPIRKSFAWGRGIKGVLSLEKQRTTPLKKSKGFSAYQRFPLTLRIYKSSEPKIVICTPKFAKELSEKGINELMGFLLYYTSTFKRSRFHGNSSRVSRELPKQFWVKKEWREYARQVDRKYKRWLRKVKK